MAELTKSLASTRERRVNAGSKMSKLLDKEEEDEFYKTQYGGFDEIENDHDFSISDSSDSENVIDSDFDIDENMDAGDDADDDEKIIQQEEKQAKRREIKRKTLYREPKKLPTSNEDDKSIRRRPIQSYTYSNEQRKTTLRSDDALSLYKNLRESTKKSSRETKENLEDEKRRKLRSKSKRRQAYRQPTQEERLRAAKKTEIENMRSLEAYKNMEIEKSKRNKTIKKIPNVPMIRYLSYREDSNDSDVDPCYRTIISFPNDETYNSYFKKYEKKSTQPELIAENDGKPPARKHSALSGLPIRYKDPLTGFEYSIAKEFSIIRDSYVRYLEQSSLKDDVSIKKFTESHRFSPKCELKLDQTKSKLIIQNQNAGSGNITSTPTTTTSTMNTIKASSTVTPLKTVAKVCSMNDAIQIKHKYRTIRPLSIPISSLTTTAPSNNNNNQFSFVLYASNSNNLNNRTLISHQIQAAPTSSSTPTTSTITNLNITNNNKDP